MTQNLKLLRLLSTIKSLNSPKCVAAVHVPLRGSYFWDGLS